MTPINKTQRNKLKDIIFGGIGDITASYRCVECGCRGKIEEDVYHFKDFQLEAYDAGLTNLICPFCKNKWIWEDRL